MSFDVDIDVKSNTKKEKFGIRAILYNADSMKISPHPSGYYFDTNMPIDKMTGNAAIEAKRAEELGFIKIDLLTNTAYDVFNSKDDVLRAADRTPDWDMLLDKNFIKRLPQLHNQYELVNYIRPRSISELADLLALLRPGKMKFLEDYKSDPEKVRRNLYRRSVEGYHYKKSHAISTAIQIVAIMNKLSGKALVTF